MWRISENKDWDSLLRFSWVSDMRGVPQSPVHHAEGDVETHTRMVVSALESLPEYNELEEQEREIVWAAALLHDVEKRSTTRIDEAGNIVSPGHAKKGAMTARSILYREIETPFALREEITGLVRHHGLPLWVLEKPDPVKALLKASLEVNTRWVAMLAKADVLGRTCNDRDELLYKIDLFRELCIEQDCWGKPKNFPSDLARFRYFRSEEQTPDFEPFDDTRTEVVLLAGIAGSGKDFYLKKHLPEHAVISLDDLRRKYRVSHRDAQGNGRIIQECKELARGYLREQVPFVWNATNITVQMRDQLIDLFTIYHARVRIVYLEVPYKKLLAQNRGRDFPIPETAIEKMVGKLEVPKAWEAHDVEYVIA
jgi:putative nucleotidyltransferase with HDIG domain